MFLRRLLSQSVGGIILSLFGYLPVAGSAILLEHLSIAHGRTTIVMLSLLVGYPLGSVAGVVLVDRWVFKVVRFQSFRIALSLGFAILGGLAGVGILFIYEELMILFTLVLTSALAAFGYNIPNLFEKRKASRVGTVK